VRRYYPFLKGLWGLVVLGLTLGLVSNWWAAKSLNPHQVVLTQVVLDFLRNYGPWILLVIVPLALITLWASWDERQHRTHFDLLKPAKKIRPQDLRFQVLEPADQPTPEKRPYYPTYISREAIVHEYGSGASYTEEMLVQSLLEGRSFVLMGEPLVGKTRTLYEIVRQMEGYRVIRPKRDAPVPDEDDFSPINGRKVILLLDDLNDYVRYDLTGFRDRLDRRAACTVVAATCRDGAELEAVRTSQRLFYTNISLKLKLRSLTVEEKHRLAQSVDKNLDRQKSYPTPGSIVAERSMDDMHERFLDLPPEQQDILRTLQLLFASGVFPYTHSRLQVVLKQLFHRDIDHLCDSLVVLEKRAFLYSPGHSDPVRPEPAYLRDAVSYREYKMPEDDFVALADVLAGKGVEDLEGMRYLGVNMGTLLQNYQQALACFQQILKLKPNDADAWFYKGWALGRLGRHKEAVTAYEKVTKLLPDNAVAWVNLGIALRDSGRYAEALTAYEQAIQVQPKLANAWFYKGNILGLGYLGREQQSVAAYERAIELEPRDSHTWDNMSANLHNLGRYQDALVASERATELDPKNARAWYNKGGTLHHLGYASNALAAYEHAIELNPAYLGAWINKGNILVDLRRHIEALDAFEHAVALDPNDPAAWAGKGLALSDLRHSLPALAAYDRALELNPEFDVAWNNKGTALYKLGQPVEALTAFERAVQINPRDITAWTNKAAMLRRLSRDQEAAGVERCSLIVRYIEEVWNKGNMDAIGVFIDPNLAYYDPTVPEGDVNGIDGVAWLVTMYRTAFPDLHVRIQDVISEDDKIATRWTMHGTQQGDFEILHGQDQLKLLNISPTSKYVAVTGATIYHVANAKIVEAWHYWDRSNLLQQLGVNLRRA